VDEAVQNARVKPLPPEKVILNTFDSYFLLDGARRLRNPIDQAANKLEAFIHVIYGDSNRIRNFENALRDVGFEEEDGIPVFSGVAAAYGVLEENEKENGALLIEIGGGCTEYVAVHNYGIIASGVLGVGMEHVANDLSIGFDMHISACRKFLQENEYLRHKQDGRVFLEVKTATGAPRRLPINSIEKIVNLRLREIFNIINSQLKQEKLMHYLSCGGVLSGGAALFPQSLEVFSNVMEIPVRVGTPLGASGAVTDLESPRYSVPWGLLKYGEEMRKVVDSRGGNSLWEKMISGMDNMSMPIFRGFSSLKNSIKF
jgi:cell division protein FtsA